MVWREAPGTEGTAFVKALRKERLDKFRDPVEGQCGRLMVN